MVISAGAASNPTPFLTHQDAAYKSKVVLQFLSFFETASPTRPLLPPSLTPLAVFQIHMLQGLAKGPAPHILPSTSPVLQLLQPWQTGALYTLP